MKTNIKNFLAYLFASITFATPLSLQAQVSQPNAWNLFVQRTDNHSVMDTFRLQTFQNNATDT